MNRELRRKQQKELKSKLTDEQFKMIYDRAFHEMVEQRVSEIWEKMSPLLVETMRENRISEDRIRKILTLFLEKTKKVYGGEKKNERLSK